MAASAHLQFCLKVSAQELWQHCVAEISSLRNSRQLIHLTVTPFDQITFQVLHKFNMHLYHGFQEKYVHSMHHTLPNCSQEAQELLRYQ